jgi:hypothetical protein
MISDNDEPVYRPGNRVRQVAKNIREGHHREAYALFCVGVALTVLSLASLVSTQITLSAILASLTFLVFETAAEPSGGKRPLEHLLRNRDAFGAFGKLLPGVRDLRVYGPTAVGVLTNAADIRRLVLRTGGRVRVLTLSEDEQVLGPAAVQLDDNLDLLQTLRSSRATAAKLGTEPGFSYRQLPVNPGFSLIIVNADDRDGYAIFECHGFKDETIGDRMHIMISKTDSPHWFTYWVTRFEAMWETAHPPTMASTEASAPAQ